MCKASEVVGPGEVAGQHKVSSGKRRSWTAAFLARSAAEETAGVTRMGRKEKGNEREEIEPMMADWKDFRLSALLA